MSSIIFDRLINCNISDQIFETDEEVEEEQYNFNNADVSSKNYLVNLYKNLKNCNYFLNTIIKNEQLDYIVLCLLKNQEFSFGIKLFSSDVYCERVRFVCEDNDVLNYLDNEEIPPILVDIIEKFGLDNIYYNGCIISEIRDYRQSNSTSNFFNSYFMILKPTSLSLYDDVKKIISLTNEDFVWENCTRFKLESKLIYLTSPKLCLDPNPCVGLLSKKLTRKKFIFCNKLFLRLPRKKFKKTISLNKQLKELNLYNFIKSRRPLSVTRVKSNTQADVSRVPMHNFEFKDVTTLATKSSSSNDNSYELTKVEEYTMEFIEVPSSTFTKLIIFRRPFDDIYFGDLTYNKNGDSKTLQKFYLGNEFFKRRYVEQFIDIYTEHGRKSIKITAQVKNDKPKTKYTLAAESYIKQKLAQKNESLNYSNVNPTTESSSNLKSLLFKNSLIKIANNQGSFNQIIIKNEPGTNVNANNEFLVQPVTVKKNSEQNNPIRVSNIISLHSQQQQQITNPISVSVYSTTATSNAALQSNSTNEHKNHAIEMNNDIIVKKEPENVTVAYLPANIIMSSPNVFTVQPTMSMEISNVKQSDN